MSPTDLAIFVICTLIVYHNFSCVKNFMRKLPSIVFRESCSLSKSGEREGWFWRVEKMESDLESLLEHFFFGLFPKFCDKELYRESPGDALRIPRKTTP
jgi:hypothetical protein